MTAKMLFAKKFLLVPAVCFAAGTLASCTTAEDPEDPGFTQHAATGVRKGDIRTWNGPGGALDKDNRRAAREGPRWDDGLREDF